MKTAMFGRKKKGKQNMLSSLSQIGMDGNSSQQMSQTSVPDFPKSSTVTCNELMLCDFERCLIYGDYSSLGSGTPDDIAERWDNIYAEYTTLMQDDGVIQMIYQLSQVQRNELHISRISMLINQL